MTHRVQLVAQCDLAGDQFVGEVVVLLLQTHVGLRQTLVLPLSHTDSVWCEAHGELIV